MSEKDAVYSIQRTYILTSASTPEKRIITCDERIDIPTIEPLTGVKAAVYSEKFSKIIPCIELAGRFLDEFELKFETNDGVTVLPVEIASGIHEPLENPYTHLRYVLVLPRGATGVKSCKIIHKATGKEVQHNFTFGIMPPPYNYDNALFGYLSYAVGVNSNAIEQLNQDVDNLSTEFQKAMFLSARGEATPSETYNIGQNGHIDISGNPRFIRGTLEYRNANPLRVNFYFVDNLESTLRTAVYFPAGSSVFLLDLITGLLCVTTTNGEDVRSVTYPIQLLSKARNTPIKLSWIVPDKNDLYMEVQQWS